MVISEIKPSANKLQTATNIYIFWDAFCLKKVYLQPCINLGESLKFMLECPDGEIGKRCGLRSRWELSLESSSLSSGTSIKKEKSLVKV